eukprot:TRINITY_DN28365_c4_g1_i1.p1 TRINITY_DN28365_c4_g1~~TRINITY_DN28365_c4_g1_i1.p1  ORF type:complete len:125 (-),score=17.01 TRINITY_DN28365_c4_g1_i1:117-491(-)
MAYRLEFPLELTGIHDVFHVSMLSHVIQHEPLEIQEDATYVEKPMRIIDTKEQVLHTKTIRWVKVLWKNHELEEATCELQDQVQKLYPYMLPEVYLYLKDQMSLGGEDVRFLIFNCVYYLNNLI